MSGIDFTSCRRVPGRAYNGANGKKIAVEYDNPISGLRKPEIVPLVGKSRATVERALASLISEGRIEFRGAPKNGGYYPKDGGVR